MYCKRQKRVDEPGRRERDKIHGRRKKDALVKKLVKTGSVLLFFIFRKLFLTYYFIAWHAIFILSFF